MGVQSHIGVQNVLKILFGADKGRSHKTSRSLIRGSLVAGTTVQRNVQEQGDRNNQEVSCVGELVGHGLK